MSIVGTGENASTERLDTRTTLFGPGGSQHIFLNVEVQELRSMSRRLRMSQWEQDSRLMMFHHNPGLHQAVQEHQRRAQDAVNQAVLESTARCETALSIDLRVAQLNNEPIMEMREREIIFRIGKRSSSSTKAPESFYVDRAQSTRSGRRCPKKMKTSSNGLQTHSVDLAT